MVLEKDLSVANRLVAALPPSSRALLLADCQLVELRHLQVLVMAGQPLAHVYFPVESFFSVVMPADDAPNVQVAMVGNEGMFPISVVLGADTSAFTCLVQGPGRAFCISRPALLARMAKDHALVDLLNRYADASQTQLAREAVCMNHHTVRQRLARRLLMNRDCSHSAELFLTHQSLAFMLDVRRESVSRAASEFEKLGLISYSHGYMVLLDEPGLERISCHCYRANLQAYDRCLESLDIERIFALRR